STALSSPIGSALKPTIRPRSAQTKWIGIRNRIAVGEAVEVDSAGEADGIFLGKPSATGIIIPVAAVHKPASAELILKQSPLPCLVPLPAATISKPLLGGDDCEAVRHLARQV